MDLTLAIATILGGLAAIWFFYEKVRAIKWRKPKFKRSEVPLIAPTPIITNPSNVSEGGWPIQALDPDYPAEVVEVVKKIGEGYRLPTGRDITGDWAEYGDRNTLSPILCAGSFTGDWKREYAFFLLAEKPDRFKLVVLLGMEQGEPEFIDLLSGNGKPTRWFVNAVAPGVYQPGPSAVSLGSPTRVRLKHHGINVGVFESADSIYYWDENGKAFKQVWMSD